MAHPQMFDDADPQLARVRQAALAYPGAAEKVSHGRPAFFTTKVFAYYGAATKDDGEWVQHPHSVVVLPDPTERDALLTQPKVFAPAYLGPYGWVGLELPSLRARRSLWAEVEELVDASYRNTAGRRLVAELDARSTSRSG